MLFWPTKVVEEQPSDQTGADHMDADECMDAADGVRDGDSKTSSIPNTKQTVVEILSVDSDGSQIEVHHVRRGGVLAEVVMKSPPPSSKTKLLGEIKHFVDGRGNESLKALCKCHSKCICWIRGTQNADLLLQWLAKGPISTIEVHSNESYELKKGIGMKVRSRWFSFFASCFCMLHDWFRRIDRERTDKQTSGQKNAGWFVWGWSEQGKHHETKRPNQVDDDTYSDFDFLILNHIKSNALWFFPKEWINCVWGERIWMQIIENNQQARNNKTTYKQETTRTKNWKQWNKTICNLLSVSGSS